MATFAKDRNIRIFDFLSGKIIKKIDESIDVYSSIQQVFDIINLSEIENNFIIINLEFTNSW
jgi:hypothetical protein